MEEQQTIQSQPPVKPPAQSAVQPSTTSPSPKRFPWKKLISGLIVFVAVVGGAGSVLAWRTTYLDNYLPASVKGFFGRGEERGEPTAEEGEPTVQENMKDWKTYTDKKYGYEVKYPKDWTIKSRPSDSILNPYVAFSCEEDFEYLATFGNYDVSDQEKTGLAEGEIEVDVTFFGCDETLKNWFHPFEKYDSQEAITVDGIEAIKAKLNYTQHGNFTYVDVFVKKGERIWQIHSITPTVTGMETLHDTFDLMVSAFKFVGTDETANWKAYKSSDFNYSFKYPSDWKLEAWATGLFGEKKDLVRISKGTLKVEIPIQENTKKLSLDAWVGEHKGETDGTVESEYVCTIDGAAGRVWVTKGFGGTAFSIFLPLGSDKILTLAPTYDMAFLNGIFERVLETFNLP